MDSEKFTHAQGRKLNLIMLLDISLHQKKTKMKHDLVMWIIHIE